MSSPAARPRGRSSRTSLLGKINIVLGLALAVVAAWLIIFGDTEQRVRLGAIAGVWGALLCAYGFAGSRSRSGQNEASLSEARNEIVLRRVAEIGRTEDAARMRAYEARLDELLREVDRTVSEQVGRLRADVAALRGDILEKVGGQIRLERIETTRLIGSDIEALQHEVRQLKTVRDALADGLDDDDVVGGATRVIEAAGPLGSAPDRPVGGLRGVASPAPVPVVEAPTVDVSTAEPEPVAAAPVPEPAATAEPEPAPAQAVPTVPPVPSRSAQQPAAVAPPAESTLPAARVAPTPRLAAPHGPLSAPAGPGVRRDDIPAAAATREIPAVSATPRLNAAPPAPSGDPFAGLPRLTPFVDDEPATATPAPVAPTSDRSADPGTRGEHRAPSEDPADEPAGDGGRHTAEPAAGSSRSGGRRRRRADDDTLARLLKREGAHR